MMLWLMQSVPALIQVDLETHVTVHEVEFLPAFMGPAGETLNQFEHILQTYGHHIKNLVGIVLALVIFVMFLRMLKSLNLVTQRFKF